MRMRSANFIEIVLVLIISLTSISIIGVETGFWTKDLRPYPDTLEQVYMGAAMLEDQTPLLPIGSELHPARYSPVHSLFLMISMKLAGTWRGAIYYSPTMILLGGLLFFLALRLNNIPRSIRLLTFALVMTSRSFIECGRNLQQEPTMLILLGISVLGLTLASGMNAGNKKMWPANIWPLIAGLCIGLLITIRLTTLPLLILLPTALILSKPTRQSALASVVFAGGATLAIGASGLYMYHLTGIWSLTGYYHWMNTGEFFSLLNWRRPLFCAEYPGLTAHAQIFSDLTGYLPGLTTLGPPFTITLMLGLIWGGWILARERKFILLALVLFSATQVTAHLFYMYYFPRFLFLAYPPIIMTAIIGWHSIIQLLYQKINIRYRKLSITLIIAIWIFLLLGTNYRHQLFGSYQTMSEKNPELQHKEDRKIAELLKVGGHVKNLSCPIFVSGIDSVHFRLQADLLHHRWPIYQLTRLPDKNFDAYTWQTPIAKQCLINKSVEQPDLPSKPRFDQIYLVDTENEKINHEQLDWMISHYGQVAIYYTTHLQDKSTTTMKSLMANRRSLEIASGHDWRLLLIK